MRTDGINEKIYCLYCKNEISGAYVVRDDSYFHPECYELIKSDSYGIDPADFNETNTDGE